MTDDATLTDFGSAASDDGDGNGDAHESDDGDAAATDETQPETNSHESDDTGLSTYAWGEYTCHRCETETGRVWRDDGEFVCPACKSW
ncbi:hypothetical protein GS429_04890 [Natronorubrum sp. JWXQ-INN-674]|uniref:DUF7573 domain-containing protein n=1 Tax=Natronorubrum halalkaliphilum TaxID=2691917 RepID=A0A6B0VLF6_9EURY|nr:hypothetical protein [Natronorubrum halalkaliphilum]MXV61409.1 hypothetical protein [Natronorubrum halalkaliphilum]